MSDPNVTPAPSEIRCRKCGGVIAKSGIRYGTDDTGWEHTAGDCETQAAPTP